MTRRVRWSLAVLASLVVLAIAAQLIAARLVDADMIRDRLEAAAAGNDVDVRIGDARFNLWSRSIDLRDVEFERTDGPRLDAARVIVTGVPLRGAIAGSPIRLGSVRLEAPVLYMPPREEDATAGNDDSDSVRIQVDRLVVRDGTLIGLGSTAPFPRFTLRGIAAEASGLALGNRGLTEHPTAVDIRTGAMERLSSDSLMKLSFEEMRYDGETETMVVERPRFEPTLEDGAFFAALDRRKTRLRISASRIEARDYDLVERFRGNLVARAFQFDSVHVDVFADKRLPSAGGDPWLPNELIRDYERRLAVDSVLAGLEIQYREIPRQEVREPGSISFDEMQVVATGVSNEDPSVPLVVETSFRLFGAPSETRMEIPLDEGEFRMDFRGSVGSIDLTRLNEITIPLQGIEIQDGRMQGMRFDIDIEGRHAGGSVWLVYDDLDVQIVDRESGEGGLFDDIKSFIANTFVLDGDNVVEDGEAPDPGQVAVYFTPRTAFFSRVWIPVRDGMMAIAKD